ncbi:calcium-binding protein [Antarctobacter sp.]|uniref:calcium-binding protein n=1 Tax=Antarctobacter sp. TaxID=1872577 RepID=UPI003A8EC863
MAFTVISNETSTQTVNDTDIFTLLPGGTLTTMGNAIQFNAAITSEATVNILGTIVTGANGVDAFNYLPAAPDAVNNLRVRVGPEGSIYGYFTGITQEVGANNSIVNEGTIHGETESAIYVRGGTNTRIENHGTMTANGSQGTIEFHAGTNSYILNTGIMSGVGQTTANATILTRSTVLVNSGTISSAEGRTVVFESDDNTVRNSGSIFGQVSFQGGADTVINTGQIGSVTLGGGADAYHGFGNGVTTGEVQGNAGNDTLAGGNLADHLVGGEDDDKLVGRSGDDTLDGGTGNDFIQGGTGNDYIEGGADNDTLNGNADDDTLNGDAGNDLLVGQDGSDVLDGGANNDTLDGGNGDDVLEGGTGNDILRGRNGEDDLAGGEGKDFLTGGQGADNFVFRSLADAGIGADRDQILDFEQGVDLIVVAGLSPGVFEFRGTAAFAPSGNPELRLVETASGSTIVLLDNNGDGTQDAEIRVANVTGLTADDFVL